MYPAVDPANFMMLARMVFADQIQIKAVYSTARVSQLVLLILGLDCFAKLLRSGLAQFLTKNRVGAGFSWTPPRARISHEIRAICDPHQRSYFAAEKEQSV